MGIGDLTTDDPSTDSDSDDPSVSYIYVYEGGHDSMSDWSDGEQTITARAYDLASSNGTVREMFRKAGAYQNIHHALSHFIAALGEAFEEDNWEPALDFILSEDAERSADQLADYLDEHDDLREEVADRLATTETAEADD